MQYIKNYGFCDLLHRILEKMADDEYFEWGDYYLDYFRSLNYYDMFDDVLNSGLYRLEKWIERRIVKEKDPISKKYEYV